MISELLTDPALHAALRLSLVALFTAAAWHKLRDRQGFAATLRDYRLLPAAWCGAAASMLIGAEIATAIALIVAPTVSAGAVAGLVLLGLYSGAMATNLARGRRDIDCGCHGPGHRQRISEWLLLRNGVAAGAAATLLLPMGGRGLGALDVFSVVAFCLSLSLVWSAGNRLLENGPRFTGQ